MNRIELTPLINALRDYFSHSPQAIGEYQLMQQLKAQGLLPEQADNSSSMQLFITHFVLFHCLYRLRDEFLNDGQGFLRIEPLSIELLSTTGAMHDIGPVEKLRNYYLDLNNLVSTSEEDVDLLLQQFWDMFSKNEVRGEALAALGLSDPASDQEIKKRYKALAKKHHPDLGGDVEHMQAINKAYQLLMS